MEIFTEPTPFRVLDLRDVMLPPNITEVPSIKIVETVLLALGSQDVASAVLRLMAATRFLGIPPIEVNAPTA